MSALGLLGCTPRPNAEECAAFADHMIQIAHDTASSVAAPNGDEAGSNDPVRERGEARRAELIERCTKSPKSAYDCAMAAKDLTALRRCGQ